MAGSEFKRISGIVLGGLVSIVTNFAGVANQISGPVTIVRFANGTSLTIKQAGEPKDQILVNLNFGHGLAGLPQGLEQGVMASGLLLMMALGVGLVIRDTINLL